MSGLFRGQDLDKARVERQEGRVVEIIALRPIRPAYLLLENVDRLLKSPVANAP